MKQNKTKSGSALIMVLWTVIIMSLLIGTFAYEMHIEAKIATLERQQFKAQEIARAGYEYAIALLNAPELTSDEKISDEIDYVDTLMKVSKLSENVHPELSTALCGIIQVLLSHLVLSISKTLLLRLESC